MLAAVVLTKIKNQKSAKDAGQISVMVAIIFQVIFILFAMVINVGLVIHDKINLQNSVDMAAYYGAMKQAEILNAMAHINYQLRQNLKLLAYRTYVVGDAGRINPQASTSESPPRWFQQLAGQNTNLDPFQDPLVCIINQFWFDSYVKKTGGFKETRDVQNFCSKTGGDKATIKAPEPLKLIPLQFVIGLSIFQQQQVKNKQKFSDECRDYGQINYQVAAAFLTAFKSMIDKREQTMMDLEKLLVVQPQNDFKDIAGRSVRDTAAKVFLKNLTRANRDSVGEEDFIFENSLSQKPFLVPIDVKVRMAYLDTKDLGGNACEASFKEIIAAPTHQDKLPGNFVAGVTRMMGADYGPGGTLRKADMIFGAPFDPQAPQKSTIGFEKDPWVLAYVHVTATSKPKLLFSPIGKKTVELKAEAFAMPFGGRIGPWYHTGWRQGAERSEEGGLVDPLLPPRAPGGALPKFANFSRFIGDNLGMRNEFMRKKGLGSMLGGSFIQFPHFEKGDYNQDFANRANDPAIMDNARPIRTAEIKSVTPDVFDAAYYSINPSFTQTYTTLGENFFMGQLCDGIRGGLLGYCFDIGSVRKPGGINTWGVKDQMQRGSYGIGSGANWGIKDPSDLLTSWAQEKTDEFMPAGAPTLMGKLPVNGPGGRTGYSVKIVSRKYLTSQLPLGGATGGTFPIKNPPQ